MYSDTFLAGYAVLAGERQAGFGTLKRGAMAGICQNLSEYKDITDSLRSLWKIGI